MRTCQLLLLCILSALQEPNVVNGISTYAGAEGGSGGIDCYLSLSGKFKYFCKDSCKEGNILLKTDGVTATNGPYSLIYEPGTGKHSGQGILSVKIKNLTMADSGRYICALGSSQRTDADIEFDIIVTDLLPRTQDSFTRTETEGRDVTLSCRRTNYTRGSNRFFCRDKCDKEEDVLIETEEDHAERGRYRIEYKEDSLFGLYITITRLEKSDQGRYKCGYGSALSPDWVTSISIIVANAPVMTTLPTSRPSAFTAMPPATTQMLPSERFSTFPATSPPTTASAPTTNVRTTIKVATTTKTATTKTPTTTTKKTTKPHLITSASSETPGEGRSLLLLTWLPILGVLLLVVGLLLLDTWRKDRNSGQTTDMSGTEVPCVVLKKITPISTRECDYDKEATDDIILQNISAMELQNK